MSERLAEFHEVLKVLYGHDAGRHLVLIGSWALYVYREHYPVGPVQLVTSDMDFAVPRPRARDRACRPTINSLLCELGYEAVPNRVDRSERYLPRADVPGRELYIEFLCAKGRNVAGPCAIPGLGITATPVRFQEVLIRHTEDLLYQGMKVTVPRPDVWAAHKIVVSGLRKGTGESEKSAKDVWAASTVVDAIGRDQVRAAAAYVGGKFETLFLKRQEELEGV